MKIDLLLKEFTEKYSKEAIQSIESLSQDFSLTSQGRKIDGFNLTEGFKLFNEYLEGYTNYKIEYQDSPKKIDHNILMEQARGHVRNPPEKDKWFKETKIPYSDIPSIIQNYLEGSRSLIEKTESLKKIMVEHDLDNESIAGINDLTDDFVDNLQESFDPLMNNLLWASGYYSKQRLRGTNSNSKAKPVFL